MSRQKQGHDDLFYIIEHETRGVLKDLEWTDSGARGRFSIEGMRGDPETTHRFYTVEQAQDAIVKINQGRKSALALKIRCSQWTGRVFFDAWPEVKV